jgi:hypothetical protein
MNHMIPKLPDSVQIDGHISVSAKVFSLRKAE